jgi:hypothetical protein
MRKQGNQKKQSKVRQQRDVNMRITHPPPIQNIGPKLSIRRRFIANAAFANLITWTNLLDSFLFASSATQGYQAFECVRVKEVEVWHCPVASSVSTVSVEFGGQIAGQVGDQKIHSDSSMGLSPAHVRCSPSRDSQASQWQFESGTAAFRLDVPSGAVIDVVLSYRGEFNAAYAVANALVAATTGAYYLRGLDGQPVASTVLVPAVPAAWVR